MAVTAIGAALAGYLAWTWSRVSGEESEAPVRSERQDAPSPRKAGRVHVDLTGPSRGAVSPVVHIVEFSNFECATCAAVDAALTSVLKKYPDDVRAFFRLGPAAKDPAAQYAARVAKLAIEQGRFWELRTRLLPLGPAPLRLSVDQHARQAGVDLRRAGNTSRGPEQPRPGEIELQTPGTLVVNGRVITRNDVATALDRVVQEEIAAAKLMLATGVPRDQTYRRILVAAGGPSLPEAELPAEVYNVPIGASPRIGGPDPKVTIVEFADFECPFCARASSVLAELRKEFGDEIQVVFKHYPLTFHPHAREAALAAEAAGEQGKFWEMHDKLFAGPSPSGDQLETYARELGLDIAKWKAALTAQSAQARLTEDRQLAERLAVSSTPSLFINGRLLRGIRPLPLMHLMIRNELARVERRLAGGLARAGIYGALTRNGLEAGKKSAAGGRPAESRPEAVHHVPLGSSRARGAPASAALVTIVEFGAYGCRFTSALESPLRKLLEVHGKEVRLVWKDAPTRWHEVAPRAAAVVRAAGPGAWALHDKLVAIGPALSPQSLERAATELGIDAKAIATNADHPRGDQSEAAALGVRGTPTVFINGRRLEGARTYEELEAIVQAELTKARAVLATGVPKAALYQTIVSGRSEGPG